MSNHDNNVSENGNYHNTNGKFAPGNPGKPKGATKNKLRDKIKTFINDNWESLPGWFEKLKPKEKIEVMLSLMPYAVSRLQSIHMSDSEGHDIQKGLDLSQWSDQDLRELIRLQEKYTNGNNN